MREAIARARGVPPSAAVIVAAVAVLTGDVLRGGGRSKAVPLAVIGLLAAMAAVRVARSWPALVSGMLAVVILIPSDGRYTLGSGLPIQLEPYRLVVALLLVGWLIALLVDPRVHARATSMDRPVLLIVAATLGSELANPGRVGSTESYVVKAVWLFACFVLWLYLVVSVIHSRAVVDRIVVVLVCAGCIEALGAVIQRKTGNNLFNHLHVVLPMFNFNPELQTGQLVRGGSIRATAAAGHPIELSSMMSMLMPLAVYLWVSRRQWRWGLALVVLLMGDFAGGSRTGIIGIATILVVYLCLRPRQTLRCWPALIPVLAVVHAVSPGALGGIQASFFPTGGLLQQQSHTFVGHGGVVLHDTRLSRIGPSLAEFSAHNPLVGEGYGTRVVGNGSNGKPNPDDNASVLDDQWLGTLLMTGLLGFIGWLWLFARMIRRLSARARLEAGTPGSWLPVGLVASTATFATSMLTYDAFSYVQATFLIFTIVALASVLLSLPPAQRPGPAGGPSQNAL
jgi:hypothetical protein